LLPRFDAGDICKPKIWLAWALPYILIPATLGIKEAAQIYFNDLQTCSAAIINCLPTEYRGIDIADVKAVIMKTRPLPNNFEEFKNKVSDQIIQSWEKRT